MSMNVFEGYEKFVKPTLAPPPIEKDEDMFKVEEVEEVEAPKQEPIDYDKLAQAMLKLQNSNNNNVVEDIKPTE